MTNARLSNIQMGVTSIVASRYLCARRLGEGAFGKVYEVVDLKRKGSPHLALKAELLGAEDNRESLRMEAYVLRRLASQHAEHAVKLHAIGRERNFNYVVMTLLSYSLADIRRRLPGEIFSLPSTLRVGLQALAAIGELHNAGFVHRDIKPPNFAFGKDRQLQKLFLIDFGLCREIMYSETLTTKLRTPRHDCPFRGTTRYCSLNVHSRKDQGRHDDLISLLYVMYEMIRGSLPWKQLDRAKAEKVKRESESVVLATGPPKLRAAFEYVSSLSYFQTPDYAKIRQLFYDLLGEQKKTSGSFEWAHLAVVPFENKQGNGIGEKAKDECAVAEPSNKGFVHEAEQTLLDIPEAFPAEDSDDETDDPTINSVINNTLVKAGLPLPDRPKSEKEEEADGVAHETKSAIERAHRKLDKPAILKPAPASTTLATKSTTPSLPPAPVSATAGSNSNKIAEELLPATKLKGTKNASNVKAPAVPAPVAKPISPKKKAEADKGKK